jgi:hypothetical protein
LTDDVDILVQGSNSVFIASALSGTANDALTISNLTAGTYAILLSTKTTSNSSGYTVEVRLSDNWA